MMTKETDADRLQKLSATHAGLFIAWQILTRTLKPGAHRAKRGSSPVNEAG